ncbi:DUF3225 domain-containing protein [bacterium]|nr:DUF3225 domain-containing protein [bacterium]
MKSLSLIFVILFLITGCATKDNFNSETEKVAILQVMAEQQKAWNNGDLEGFMQGYWKSDSLRFASGGNVRYGWQATLDGYKRGYPDTDAIGQLTFSDMNVTFIAPDAAVVFGRWALERKDDNPNGLYTLIFRKFKEGWRVAADHTSSADE